MKYTIENDLKKWFKYIIEANPNGHISLRTSKLMNDIINNRNTKNYIIFDNAGGCVFDIHEVKDSDSIDIFIKHIGSYLVIGTVRNGISKLSDEQLRNPHYSICRYLEHLEIKKRTKLFKNKEVVVSDRFWNKDNDIPKKVTIVKAVKLNEFQVSVNNKILDYNIPAIALGIEVIN